MAKPTLDATVASLVELCISDRELTAALIDDLVDPYLDDLKAPTLEARRNLADAFFVAAPASERSKLIFQRILKRNIP